VALKRLPRNIAALLKGVSLIRRAKPCAPPAADRVDSRP
jgi:hypothetical protein